MGRGSSSGEKPSRTADKICNDHNRYTFRTFNRFVYFNYNKRLVYSCFGLIRGHNLSYFICVKSF